MGRRDLRPFVRVEQAGHKAENTLLVLEGDAAKCAQRSTHAICWSWKKIGRSDGWCVEGGDFHDFHGR